MTAMRLVSSAREEELRIVKDASIKSRARTWALPLDSAGVSPASKAARLSLWWTIGFTIIWGALLLTTLPAAAQEFQIYVPMVSTEDVQGSGREPVKCTLSSEESAIEDMMVAEVGQQRVNPVCDPVLSQVARARARDMALRDYFSHTNPDGNGPNLLVRQAGYLLPDWYGDEQNANNIESISAGHVTANDAWQAWLNSSSHRTHVLGTEPFYAEQAAYGVGYYYDPTSHYQHYWVFLSAPPDAE
jgi:uncharacterized protein YkwD